MGALARVLMPQNWCFCREVRSCKSDEQNKRSVLYHYDTYVKHQ